MCIRDSRYTIPQLRALADREGLLLVQAHPFRTGLTREEMCIRDSLITGGIRNIALSIVIRPAVGKLFHPGNDLFDNGFLSTYLFSCEIKK